MVRRGAASVVIVHMKREKKDRAVRVERAAAAIVLDLFDCCWYWSRRSPAKNEGNAKCYSCCLISGRSSWAKIAECRREWYRQVSRKIYCPRHLQRIVVSLLFPILPANNVKNLVGALRPAIKGPDSPVSESPGSLLHKTYAVLCYRFSRKPFWRHCAIIY